MAACEPGPYSLRLKRVFGPSLANTTCWYAVSSEWSYRPNHNTISSTVPPFIGDIVEVSIHDLVDNNGAKVHPSWFGSGRKKDTVVVSTLFGILAKAVRGKKPQDDKVIGSLEFKIIKALINSTPINEMVGRSEIPAIFPETPPTSPEDNIPSKVIKPCNIESTLTIKQPFKALKEFEMCQMGPRLKMKRAGLVANECLAVLQQELTSFAPDLGKVFGYGLLHCAKDNQNFVREVISTALETVAEKQGIEKAFATILCEDLNTRYLESLRVPHWLQLYVKLTTKLPNRSWQTLLNFLNIGRSGVSFIFTSFFYLLTIRNLLSVRSGEREGSGV